jgi:Homeodomain-like domain
VISNPDGNMVNGKPTMHHHRDPAPDNDFNDPGGWDKASYSAHPIDSMEPLSDEPNPYRAAAIYHLQLMYVVDEFVAAAPDARLAVIAVAVVLGWPSARGWTVPEIAGQLGVSASTITRACARFREMSGLPAAGFKYDGVRVPG